MATYINENWDSVTAPALPAGWSITGGSGASGVTSTTNKYSGTNALRFSGVSGSYIYAYKTTTDTNHGNVWIEAKYSPVQVGAGDNYFFLHARCTGNPSGANAPANSYCFNGSFSGAIYWQLQVCDGSGNRTQYLINSVTPTLTAGDWYRCIMSIENNADAVYQQVLCYVQRMSDSKWLLPDGTWTDTQSAFFVATGNPVVYNSGWDTGTTAAFGCYLSSGQILDMDDCIFQDTPFADATPASPPAAGNEVEMIPTGTTGSDAGTSSHDATHLNASGFADYYRSITIGQYIYLDAGRALTPTAFVWTPALGSTAFNDYSILLATGYEIFSVGAAVEGASSSSGPWTRLGQVATNRIPEPNIFTTQRLDSTSPGGTYRYYRFVPSPSLPCVLSQFRMITEWTSGMSWRPCKPIITPAAGRKAAGTTVAITSTTGTVNGTATAIYYTTDGSTPTTGSTLYSGPITLASNSPAETVIKAIAYNSGASTTTSEVATGVFVVAAAFVPDTNATAYGTSNNWPQDWYDDRGVLLQSNSGHVFYDTTQSKYFMIGGNFNIGVTADSPPGKRGWCIYYSTDLFNWTYHSSLPKVPAAWASAYGYQTRAHILVNPSPIDSNKKYVLWMHLGDSGGTAACATAPSMDGPWIWRTMAQPNSTTVGDSNVFYDVVDDGTGNSRNKAWFVFTSNSLTKIKICQLDPATDWTSFTGSNTQVYNADGEAVVLFNYGGYYYLIFSAATPYGSGASTERYISATTLAGLNSATPASIYSSSPGSAAEVAYNAQSTCMFQVNGLSSPGFIYMADVQDSGESPVNLYHARMAWWPVSTTTGGNKVNAFPSPGVLSMPFPDSWDMSYLPAAATSYSDSVTEAASASETSSNIATLVAASTEAASASESNSSTFITASAASESASSSETSTGTAAYPCSGSEAASGSESSSCTLTAVASATEAASASESSSATIVTAASVSESASASDACSSTPATSGDCTEAAGASESSSAVLLAAASSTEAASASDSASCIATYAGAVVETATASDSLNVVVTFVSSASESASASETWTSIDTGAEGSDFVIYCSLEIDHEFTASLSRDHTFDVPL